MNEDDSGRRGGRDETWESEDCREGVNYGGEIYGPLGPSEPTKLRLEKQGEEERDLIGGRKKKRTWGGKSNGQTLREGKNAKLHIGGCLIQTQGRKEFKEREGKGTLRGDCWRRRNGSSFYYLPGEKFEKKKRW